MSGKHLTRDDRIRIDKYLTMGRSIRQIAGLLHVAHTTVAREVVKHRVFAAERSIRPTVIARKISMGSQGKNGARNREIITSVLATVKNRGGDPYRWLVEVLDSLARAPDTDVAAALPEVDQTLRKKRRISGADSRPA